MAVVDDAVTVDEGSRVDDVAFLVAVGAAEPLLDSAEIVLARLVVVVVCLLAVAAAVVVAVLVVSVAVCVDVADAVCPVTPFAAARIARRGG